MLVSDEIGPTKKYAFKFTCLCMCQNTNRSMSSRTSSHASKRYKRGCSLIYGGEKDQCPCHQSRLMRQKKPVMSEIKVYIINLSHVRLSDGGWSVGRGRGSSGAQSEAGSEAES